MSMYAERMIEAILFFAAEKPETLMESVVPAKRRGKGKEPASPASALPARKFRMGPLPAGKFRVGAPRQAPSAYSSPPSSIPT